MRILTTATAAVFAAGLCLSAFADTTTPLPPPPAPPAPATQPAQPVDPEKAKLDAYNNEIICRTEDETGTRLRKTKICMTRKEWRQGAQDAQDAVTDLQNKGATSGVRGN